VLVSNKVILSPFSFEKAHEDVVINRFTLWQKSRNKAAGTDRRKVLFPTLMGSP
jgi:hypothetical protein